MDTTRKIATVGYWYDASRVPAYAAGHLDFPDVHAVAADGMPVCDFRPTPPEMDYCWAAQNPYWPYVGCKGCLAVGEEQRRQAEREVQRQTEAQRMLDRILGR